MKRSHRLLREVHARRVARMMEARRRGPYDAFGELEPFEAPISHLCGEGLVDREPTGDPIEAVAHKLITWLMDSMKEKHLVPDLGAMIACVALEERRTRSGAYRTKVTDREVAKQCMALAEAAVLDRMHRATGTLLREMASADHRVRPYWPRGYVAKPSASEREFLANKERLLARNESLKATKH